METIIFIIGLICMFMVFVFLFVMLGCTTYQPSAERCNYIIAEDDRNLCEIQVICEKAAIERNNPIETCYR